MLAARQEAAGERGRQERERQEGGEPLGHSSTPSAMSATPPATPTTPTA
jgi:hypothetical protein